MMEDAMTKADERWLQCLDRAIAMGCGRGEDAIKEAQRLYDAMPSSQTRVGRMVQGSEVHAS